VCITRLQNSPSPMAYHVTPSSMRGTSVEAIVLCESSKRSDAYTSNDSAANLENALEVVRLVEGIEELGLSAGQCGCAEPRQ